MQPEIGILLDNSVILTYCREQKNKGFSIEFIYSIERRPNLGLTTNRIENRVLKQLKDNGSQESFYRFYELRDSLKKEGIDKSEYERNFEDAKKFSFGLKGIKTIRTTPFRRLLREDVERIAEAICIRPRYGTLYFTSLDTDFIDPLISSRIEKKFKIKCKTPKDLLKEPQINI
jgi:hypothetical protein